MGKRKPRRSAVTKRHDGMNIETPYKRKTRHGSNSIGRVLASSVTNLPILGLENSKTKDVFNAHCLNPGFLSTPEVEKSEVTASSNDVTGFGSDLCILDPAQSSSGVDKKEEVSNTFGTILLEPVPLVSGVKKARKVAPVRSKQSDPRRSNKGVHLDQSTLDTVAKIHLPEVSASQSDFDKGVDPVPSTSGTVTKRQPTGESASQFDSDSSSDESDPPPSFLEHKKINGYTVEDYSNSSDIEEYPLTPLRSHSNGDGGLCKGLNKLGVIVDHFFRDSYEVDKELSALVPHAPNLATLLLKPPIEDIDNRIHPFQCDFFSGFSSPSHKRKRSMFGEPEDSDEDSSDEEVPEPMQTPGTPKSVRRPGTPEAVLTPKTPFSNYFSLHRRCATSPRTTPYLEPPPSTWMNRSPTQPDMTAPRFFNTPRSTLAITALDVDIPPEEMCKILSDYEPVIFVETWSCGRNISNTVRRVLKSMGAKVKKKFTKDVNLMVFVGGSYVNYWRAVNNKIPIVDTDWIEACKMAKFLVDAAYYRPDSLVIYDDIPCQFFVDAMMDVPEFSSDEEDSGDESFSFDDELLDTQKTKSYHMQRPKFETCPMGFPKLNLEHYYSEIYGTQEKQSHSTEDALKSGQRSPSPKIVPSKKRRKLYFKHSSIIKVRDSSDLPSSSKGKETCDLTPGKKKVNAKKNLKKVINDEMSESFLSFCEFSTPNKRDGKAPKASKSLVFVGFDESYTEKLKRIVFTLGEFTVQENVTNSTTHIVSVTKNRSRKLLEGLIRGCWVVSSDWILKCGEAGKWLSEEQFEMTEITSAANARLERKAFGPKYRMDLFSNTGSFFVTRSTSSNYCDLKALIKLGKGTVVRSPKEADVIIGGNRCRTTGNMDSYGLNEKWVIDCILAGKTLPTEKYLF